MSEDYLAQQQPTLIWNTVRSVWEMTGTESLLCEHLEPFSQTWPSSGMMRNGQVFKLPMQELRTTASESSSSPILLATPKAQEGAGGALGEETARARGNHVGVRDQAMDLAKLNGERVSRTQINLPTQTTRDYKDGSEPHERNGVVQTDTVARAVFNSGEVLLPTTRTSMKNGPTQKELDAGNPKNRLETVTNWGKFELAIRRWEETLGRSAPAPTKPDGKDGAHRLSPNFTEWMMGVPEGWICDVELTRNEMLKACGNGVVPQQAELALKILLEGIEIEPAGGGQSMTMFPTPTVSDTYTDNLKSSQQKDGSMHSVTLPQAVRMVSVD